MIYSETIEIPHRCQKNKNMFKTGEIGEKGERSLIRVKMMKHVSAAICTEIQRPLQSSPDLLKILNAAYVVWKCAFFEL